MDDIRSRLLSRLTDLTARTGRLETDRRAELDPDAEEQAAELESEEVVDALDEAARAEIAALQAALTRFDSGTYGRCEVCGVAIPRARLAAIPTTTRCIDHG